MCARSWEPQVAPVRAALGPALLRWPSQMERDGPRKPPSLPPFSPWSHFRNEGGGRKGSLSSLLRFHLNGGGDIINMMAPFISNRILLLLLLLPVLWAAIAHNREGGKRLFSL